MIGLETLTQDELRRQADIARRAMTGDKKAAAECTDFCSRHPSIRPANRILAASRWKELRTGLEMMAGYAGELAAMMDRAECRCVLDLMARKRP